MTSSVLTTKLTKMFSIGFSLERRTFCCSYFIIVTLPFTQAKSNDTERCVNFIVTSVLNFIYISLLVFVLE